MPTLRTLMTMFDYYIKLAKEQEEKMKQPTRIAKSHALHVLENSVIYKIGDV